MLVPVVAIEPGFNVPGKGKPLNTTDPVATVQVGCVGVAAIGADGVDGCALIVTFADEVHPVFTSFTVTVCGPAANAPDTGLD